MSPIRRPASLTSRLVLTAVGLVVAVAALIGVVATTALHASLIDQIDDDVRTIAGVRPDGVAERGPAGRPGRLLQRRGGPENLAAILSETDRQGVVVGGRDQARVLSEDALDQLSGVPVDGQVHQRHLDDLGTYRLVAVQRGPAVEVNGLPTASVGETVSSLVAAEAALILVGGLAAAGAGLLLVRRQLRPLTEVADTAHRVAELPLAEGEIDLRERVPEHLTDERTEVGQVGAALNTLLAHMEASLEARQRSEQQVRQFVADASHELRTPLATIAGYTELARRRPDPANTATALDKVEEEAARMKSLVEDLLLLARLDAGRPLVSEPVDLTRLLVEAVSDARVLGPDHAWRLDLPDEPIEVTADEQRLHQVITNLLTNARKHTPAGTTVTVSADARGFTVRDDGPGFPPEFAERAFERFTRGDISRSRAGGAGLGLSLVQAIVAALGGTVSLRSEPGETTVSVRLDDGLGREQIV